jgi:hypothetical protein
MHRIQKPVEWFGQAVTFDGGRGGNRLQNIFLTKISCHFYYTPIFVYKANDKKKAGKVSNVIRYRN